MNILTIDFDIIMKPSIQLYNDLVEDNKPIQNLINQYPQLDYCMPADFYIYEYLTRFITKQFSTGLLEPHLDTWFVKEHHDMIPLFEGWGENNYLWNIDHHHDLGYNRIGSSTIIKKPNCGNWAKYLIDNKYVSSYTWIHNENSQNPNNTMLVKNYLNYSYNLKDFNLDNLPKLDKLIICNSPQWIPDNIQPLFTTWMSIYDEVCQCNSTFWKDED